MRAMARRDSEQQMDAHSKAATSRMPDYRPGRLARELATAGFRPKLKVDQPGDVYEQEADEIADRVMRSRPTGDVSGSPRGECCSGCASGVGCSGSVQRQAAATDPAAHGSEVSSETESRIRSGGSVGQPLPGPTRAFFEPRLVRDLGHVRVHTGPDAVLLSEDMHARAFTHGSHVWLGSGVSAEPSHTLAHELAHVVQSDRGAAHQLRRQASRSPNVREKAQKSYDARAPQTKLTMSLFNAAYPGIMSALDYQHRKIWFDIIAGWQANREIDEKLRAMDQKAREEAWSDPSYGTFRLTPQYKARAAAINAHRKFVDEGTSRAPLDPAKILKAEISAPQRWNVDAEHRFRTWAVEYFSARPLEAELSTRHELASTWEKKEHPELEGGFHANLLWGGSRLWNTGGYIGWDDLMRIPEFHNKYEADVSNGPNIQAIQAAIHELASHITEMKIEHENRSESNAEHGVIRHISEALGGPSKTELAILRLRVQLHPDDTDAKADLAEKEAEAGSYPRMKGPEGIWFEPDTQLVAARRFLKAGEIELAAGAVAECQRATAIATARLAGYERRVMSGAGLAVKWLQRAKTAGKIASAFTGAGGIVRASLTAAGYTFAQEGSQQVVAHWIDPSNKIDIVGLTEEAAVDGLATLFGGLTQGAFTKALSARFEARMVASGLSEATTRTALSAAGATAASFYNVPAKVVLDKIIAGKAMPHSLSDVCDMVVTEAVQSGAMDVVGGYVHTPGAGRGIEPTPGKTGPEVTPPKELVEALAGGEASSATRLASVAGHDVKLTKSGLLVICTECTWLRERFARELADDPALLTRMTEAEGKAAKGLLDAADRAEVSALTAELQRAREARLVADVGPLAAQVAAAGDVRAAFAPVLARRPAISSELAKLEQALASAAKVDPSVVAKIGNLQARLAQLHEIDAISKAPRNAQILEVSADKAAANYYETIAGAVPGPPVVLEFPDGSRIWRDTLDGPIRHEATLGKPVGRAGMERDKVTAAKHGNLPPGPNYQLAHSLGQGTGFESPYGVCYAPGRVNQTLQNHGIEAYMRRLAARAAPGEAFRVLTKTTVHPGTLRLATMDYTIVRVAGGQAQEVATYSIRVTSSAEHPLVTAGILQFSPTTAGQAVAGRVQLPRVLTRPFSFAY